MKKILLILGLALIFDASPCKASATQDNHEETQTQNVYNALLRRHSHAHHSREHEIHGKCLVNFFCGPKGPKGERGRRGPTGATGPTGPTGPARPVLANFISLYDLNSDNVSVNLGGNVTFNHKSTQNGSIAPFTAPSDTITITEPGTYKVTFGISSNESDLLFALQENGSTVSGAVYNNGNTAGLSGLTIDIEITAVPTNLTIKFIRHIDPTNLEPATLIISDAEIFPNATVAFIEVHQIL